MELVNQTPMTAELVVSSVEPDLPRVGMLVAKATFRFDANGKVEAETQEPFPIFLMDEKTELGLLPRDDLPRRDQDFDVILLGKAKSPTSEPVTARDVALAVGEHRQTIRIVGDRMWEGVGDEATIGAPEPFREMPLTWERAFGGSADVLIDRESPITLTNPFNPSGTGFTAEPALEHIRESFACPDGFPTCDLERALPNLEDPSALIMNWKDNPDPVCWATVPMESGLHAQRFATVDEEADQPVAINQEQMFHRAHPAWVIPLPPPKTLVQMFGMSDPELIRFLLPQVRVLVDYEVGDRKGTRELAPQTLVLLTQEEKFFIVYRLLFNFNFEEETHRRMRLRTEKGWYVPKRNEGSNS